MISSSANGQNAARTAQEKADPQGPRERQELPNGHSTGRGPILANKLDAAAPPAAPVQAADKAERTGPGPAPDEAEKGMTA